MFRWILVLSCVLFCVGPSPAQLSHHRHWPEVAQWLSPLAADFLEEEEAANRYRDANRLIGEEKWGQAAALIEDLYEQEPENRNLAFKLALCLRSVKGRIEEAVPLAHLSANGEFAKRYNALDFTENLPSEEAIELALDIFQHAGHYAEAMAMAQRMVDRYPERDFRHNRAKQALKDCAFAMACVAEPRDMGIRPEAGLNSEARDFSPVVAPDGGTVYFTSYRNQTGPQSKKKGRLFRANQTADGWGKAEPLLLGSASEDLTTVGILGDEASLLVHRGRGQDGDVWTASWNREGALVWGEKVAAPIASKHWETSMTERFDGQERIFVSDRPGGQGGRDLYRTVLLPDGSWSKPLNLGKRVNTAGEEESPVLSADGRSLVFSSNGHQGMGGFDLFRCVRLDNGSWSEPEHMGYPLNTPGDEVMVSLDASGQSGYLSSSRQGGLDLDIFSVEVYDAPEEALAVFIGKVLQWQSGDVLEVRSVDEGEPVLRVFRARPESGSYVAALPACREYRFSWMRGQEVVESRLETVACDAAYGKERRIGRLENFGSAPQAEPHSPTPSPVPEQEADKTEAAPTHRPVPREEKGVSSESRETFKGGLDSETETMSDAAGENGASGIAGSNPLAVLEFEAVSETVEFGYGRFMTESDDQQVESMVQEILVRRAAGEVPLLEISGSASFVPVKNKQAFKTNEQLAKMRAEKARDAIILALSAKGLNVGKDVNIVLNWGVAGPEYQGDAVSKRAEYRNHQYAKFSLGRQWVEQR